MGELERSRGVEGVWNCGKVVDGAKHNGIRPSSHGNERELETNMPCQEVEPCREVEPGDHIGKPKASKAIGAVKGMEMVSDTMGDKMVRMVQQAAHTATQNESKQDH